MGRILLTGLATVVCLAIVGAARAEVDSGPKVGEAVPELKVLPLTGALEGKESDYVAERKDKPTIYLLIPAETFDRPIARFVKTLDGKVTDSADVVAVWLTADQAATKTYLPRAQQSLKLEHTPLTVYPGEKSGPGAWAIDSRAHLTAVVSDGKNVTAKFGFVSTNETDVPAVLDAWKAAAKTAKKE